MKRVLTILALGFSSLPAAAALIDRGGGLIYDTDLNLTWLADANAAIGLAFDDGTNTADGRMSWSSATAWAADLAVRVVPTFEPAEDGDLGLGLGAETTAVQHLAFQGGEEALGHGVVVGITDRSHRWHDAGFPAAFAEGVTGVLRPAIRVMNDRL